MPSRLLLAMIWDLAVISVFLDRGALSKYESLSLTNLLVMQPAFARAIERMDPEPVREMVRECVGCGAQALDINPGPAAQTAAGAHDVSGRDGPGDD